MSFFEGVPQAPPDAIFGLNLAFKADSAPNKLNLGVGAYRTEEGKTLILNSVQKADEYVVNSKNFNHEYLAIDGLPEFYNAAAKLLFGEEVYSSLSNKIVSMQCLSGTGSLRTGMEFIKRFQPNSKVFVSEPSWPNHKNIFVAAGVSHGTYRYYKNNDFDFDGFMEDLKAAPDRSVILLHACAHNPTGMDPSPKQWESIAELIQAKCHFAFLDCAYQGFASGDLQKDAFSVRLFAKRGIEFIVAQSFAKNFGLYGERIGAIHMVVAKNEHAEPVRSQLKQIARAAYSNPPCHGAYIVSQVLNTPALYEEWSLELAVMAHRIQDMRQKLYDALVERGINWPHLMKQIGMFGFTGMTAVQVTKLTQEHHIYMTLDGRISLPGLSTKTVVQLADAIKQVVI